MTQYPNYDDYERLDSFTPGRLNAYREMLLHKTRPQVEFVLNKIPHRPLDVVEYGCGNGRFLIGLANTANNGRANLRRGLGIDLSSSRIAFADMWKWDWSRHLNYGLLSFVSDNIVDLPPSMTVGYTLAVCITGCYQYLYPADPMAPSKLLQSMRNSSYALFELYRKPQMGRTWHKLPDEDPWEYLLDEYEDVGDWVRHTKTFLKADGEKDVRVENLAYYEMPVFLKHLERAGFKNVHWAKQNSTSMVILVS